MQNYASIIAQELNIRQQQTEAVIRLLDEDATVPFIARYRKEQTGSCDDQVLRELSVRLEYLRGLEKRREEILNAIQEPGNATPELEQQIAQAQTLARLEDLYRPFRPQRRPRASTARARGPGPLATPL